MTEIKRFKEYWDSKHKIEGFHSNEQEAQDVMLIAFDNWKNIKENVWADGLGEKPHILAINFGVNESEQYVWMEVLYE